jgi:hypothetical protein
MENMINEESTSNNKIYLFFREDMFYPLELVDDDDANANAECNHGTAEVRTFDGEIIWKCK